MNKFNLQNRRYVGSKSKLSDEIVNLINDNCEGDVFFDVFAGTAIMSEKMLPYSNEIIINDFLYSNEIIYKGFFASNDIDLKRMKKVINGIVDNIKYNSKSSNYVVANFGDKYFSKKDAFIIGEIREKLNDLLNNNYITANEFNVLLSSLVYSVDKIANTVGHYDAYRKKQNLKDLFQFRLIKPINTQDKIIKIYRRDSNELVRDIRNVDIAFIDPPYNSRQYSRFYHVLENIVKWEKPELFGVAMKPEPENMSEYSRIAASQAFEDLIDNIHSKYIVVTYNNTYNPKSSSSRNKIEIEELENILKNRGKVKRYALEHNYFNAGKTDFNDHREFVYIVETK